MQKEASGQQTPGKLSRGPVLLEGVLKPVQSTCKMSDAGAGIVTTILFECDGLVSDDIARLDHMQRKFVVAEVGLTQGELSFVGGE